MLLSSGWILSIWIVDCLEEDYFCFNIEFIFCCGILFSDSFRKMVIFINEEVFE